MHELYLAALGVSVAVSLLGIFSSHFDDNTLQRIGLAVIGSASVSEIYLEYIDASCCQSANGKALFVIGFAAYSIGTVVKVIKHKG